MEGGRGSDRYDAAGTKQDWYRISFGESKDSVGWNKGTTTVVVTAEMGDGEQTRITYYCCCCTDPKDNPAYDCITK